MPKVKVDWSKCTGCGTCADTCPASVFELQELSVFTDSKKSVPVRAEECVLCFACEASCPSGAITVEE